MPAARIEKVLVIVAFEISNLLEAARRVPSVLDLKRDLGKACI